MMTMKTSNVVQENEVYYISGNPNLDASKLTTANLNYSWMPSNKFGMSIYGSCESYYKRMIAVFDPYLGGSAIKRTYVNNGEWLTAEVGLPVNWKPFDGKLQLYANPRLAMYKSTGIYKNSFSHFLVTLQATYYLNNLYFQALYESRKKSMDSESPTIQTGRNFHSLTVGWSNSAWNVRVGVRNIFNKGWKSGEISTVSHNFAERITTYGTSCHPSLTLSVTYTVGYGKKVKRGNEDPEHSNAASAILK